MVLQKVSHGHAKIYIIRLAQWLGVQNYLPCKSGNLNWIPKLPQDLYCRLCLFVSLCVSLFLSLTHIHAHTQTKTSILFNSLLDTSRL